MQKVNYSIFINAPREKVWETMLGKDTYTLWTTPFSPGSYYEGSWDKGSKITFLGPDPEGGGEAGMVGMIAENIPHEFVSIRYVSMMKNGVEMEVSEEEKAEWSEGYENYTFKDRDGGTEVLVELSVPDKYKDMFNEMWPKALEKLKEVTEK